MELLYTINVYNNAIDMFSLQFYSSLKYTYMMTIIIYMSHIIFLYVMLSVDKDALLISSAFMLA